MAAARTSLSASPSVYLHHTKILPEVVKAAPKATVWVDVSESPLAYWESLQQIWWLGEGFTILEHDIICRPDILRAFQDCPEPWCTFVYSDLCHQECREAYNNQLGCTRFREECLREVQLAVDDIPDELRGWERVNEGLGGNLRAANYRQHWHEPPVLHLHK